jgi:hypothetical protein
MTSATHRFIAIAALAAPLLLSACAGSSRSIPREPPRCMNSETLVCYGRGASRLDTEMSEVDFCKCEQVLDRL